MARVFHLVKDETGRETGRGASFDGILSYVLRDAGPEAWRGVMGLTMGVAHAAAEMKHTLDAMHLAARRSGPKTKRPVLHAVLAWHPADLAWLTGEHLAQCVASAVEAMGLAGHQCVWAAHTDTGKPHVHVVANLVHPETGDVARLGLVKKRMSAHCAAYERSLGDIRCKRRFEKRPANENRTGSPQGQGDAKELRACFQHAPRP
jgi:hypothetical protein